MASDEASKGSGPFRAGADCLLVDLRLQPGASRAEVDGAAVLRVHLPNIGAQGGNPLASGLIDCTILDYAWPDFDRNAFLWSHVEREHDAYGRSFPYRFTQL